jgi:hypothetical protein
MFLIQVFVFSNNFPLSVSFDRDLPYLGPANSFSATC